jgi:hypothetical protein
MITTIDTASLPGPRPTAREMEGIQASGANECCKRADNLIRQELSPDRIINTCFVCGRRHFWFHAEPLNMRAAT